MSHCSRSSFFISYNLYKAPQLFRELAGFWAYVLAGEQQAISLTISIIQFNRKMSARQFGSKMSASCNSQGKGAKGSPSSSEDCNRSTVKRLFSSVFSIIDSDRQISHFDQSEPSSRIDTLLQNSALLSHLHSKLTAEGFFQGYKFPILRLTLFSLHKTPARPEIDLADVEALAARFGQLHRVVLSQDKTEAYLFYYSILNAYACCKLMRLIDFRLGSRELSIDWVHNCGYHPALAGQVHKFIEGLKWECLRKEDFDAAEDSSPLLKQSKLTCRYDIQIENQRDFQVARRIIGPKGCNMKRIIEEVATADPKPHSDSLNELLKLRLRGRGSGYKEGPDQQESTQSLHLCVSAKDEAIYNQACLRVERLLTSIYLDYLEFTKKQGKVVQLSLKKIVLGQSVLCPDESVPGARAEGEKSEVGSGEDPYRICPQKIGELLEMRNKARRELNFMEADRIRNYLRSLGVCLIDEKGRRGKAADVTTWKYVY